MVGATTLSLFTVCQQWEQVGTILIMIIADRTSAPPCVHGRLWRGAPVVLKHLKGASRHQVMWKAGGRELWCGCCKSVAGMICVKGHVEADRDKGQAFRAEWASDCWLTRCLLFCFLNDAGSRPHCDLWWNGLSATCGPRKTLEQQHVFRKASPHQKQERWGVSPSSRQHGHGESEGMPSYSPLSKTRAK